MSEVKGKEEDQRKGRNGELTPLSGKRGERRIEGEAGMERLRAKMQK
jgi:hypothetical protein